PSPAPTPAPTELPTPTQTPAPSITPVPTATFVPVAPTPTLEPLSAERRAALFAQVWTLVRENYVYEDYRGNDWEAVRAEFEPRVLGAASEEEAYAQLGAMIERLGDDHTVFLSPQDVYNEQARFSGSYSFGGIGVQIRSVANGALITDLAADGPAAQGGLQRREVITAIDGVRLAGGGDENPIRLARGQPGTEVMVTVEAVGGGERELVLIRQVISSNAFPAVVGRWLPDTNAILLEIDTFNEQDLDQKVRTKLEELLASGTPDALVIDVRDNGGGRLDYLVNVLGLFIDGGDVGSYAGRGQSTTISLPAGRTLAALRDTPITVLTSADSVSAAEIFAAGMQLRGRATLVGEPTAGNTEVLTLHFFDGGSQIRLAERAYRTPDGELIEGRGVQPDLPVAAEWWRFPAEDDPYVRAALAAVEVQ
ncbi:MAG: PDZ domain-containing protein, partial [Roseiflexaceae bacterium]|nr:PDZ domain-containing protein [Roseiflexaceae bacterium]